MNILAIADRPPRQSIKKTLAENSIDLVCTLGDLTQFDLQELADITAIPKIGVYGNHCSGLYFEPLGIMNMHLKTFEYEGITFGGFEGSLKYKESSAKMYTQEQAVELLKKFPHVDIMIAHSPPHGINDEPDDTVHAGFKALRSYVEQKKPKYLFHGHTYPSDDQLVRKYQDTEIVYVFGDKIISISI